MLIDFLEIPNFFKDPDSVYRIAMQQQFYKLEDNPIDKNSKITYNGTRTLPLGRSMDAGQYESLTNEFYSSCCKSILKSGLQLTMKAESTCYFASLLESDISTPSLCHTDTTILSGFVYLQKEKPKHPFLHGTSVIYNDKNYQIDYEYNKCVIFRGDLVHTPNHGFGDSLESSRLTFNMFINSIDISVTNVKFKLKL